MPGGQGLLVAVAQKCGCGVGSIWGGGVDVQSLLGDVAAEFRHILTGRPSRVCRVYSQDYSAKETTAQCYRFVLNPLHLGPDPSTGVRVMYPDRMRKSTALTENGDGTVRLYEWMDDGLHIVAGRHTCRQRHPISLLGEFSFVIGGVVREGLNCSDGCG